MVDVLTGWCILLDLNIGAHSLPVLVLGNTYESNILKVKLYIHVYKYIRLSLL